MNSGTSKPGPRFEHAGNAVLGEQALDHFGLHLVWGEGDFDQLAAAAATSTTVVVSIRAAAAIGALGVGTATVAMR